MSARGVTAALAVAALAVAAAPAAHAKDGDVLVRGACTKSATSKLKLSREDGRIEVELEVDQNRNGVPWKVTLRRNGAVVVSTTAVTRAPSGSFEVRRVLGPGKVLAVAVSRSGERCIARAGL
jgi:hypothetical protein